METAELSKVHTKLSYLYGILTPKDFYFFLSHTIVLFIVPYYFQCIKQLNRNHICNLDVDVLHRIYSYHIYALCNAWKQDIFSSQQIAEYE